MLQEIECPVCKDPFEPRRKEQATCSKKCAAKKRTAGSPLGRPVRSRTGRRPDLDNRYFRSAMEANYARYLNLRCSRGELKGWEYEPRIFYFPIKRGTVCYTPDFLVYLSDGTVEWHETKGYMDKVSLTKLKRFKKYYPEEASKLVVVDKTMYSDISKEVMSLIPAWE